MCAKPTLDALSRSGLGEPGAATQQAGAADSLAGAGDWRHAGDAIRERVLSRSDLRQVSEQIRANPAQYEKLAPGDVQIETGHRYMAGADGVGMLENPKFLEAVSGAMSHAAIASRPEPAANYDIAAKLPVQSAALAGRETAPDWESGESCDSFVFGTGDAISDWDSDLFEEESDGRARLDFGGPDELKFDCEGRSSMGHREVSFGDDRARADTEPGEQAPAPVPATGSAVA